MEADDAITFCQSDLPCTLLAIFEDMRKSGELSDVKIKVRNCTFSAHRVILAAGIPYFRSIFTKSTIEEKETTSLDELDPQALESLISFAYTSKVEISFGNVYRLLLTADFLQVHKVRDACVEFLLERFTVRNVLEVRALAQRINNQNLIESSKNYILENFEPLSKSLDFFSFTHSDLKEMICEDDLNAASEEIVFEAVLTWVKDSSSERQAMLPDLLSEVRMTHLSSDYLATRVTSEELISKSAPCRDLVDQVKKYHLMAKDRSEIRSIFKTLPRNCNRVGHCLYAVCQAQSSALSVHSYDSAGEEWNLLVCSPLQRPRGILHVTGMVDKLLIFLNDRIETYHLKSRHWEVLDNEHQKIAGAAVVLHEDAIYWFGSAHECASNKVLHFDPHQNKWLKERKMNTNRCYPAAASLRKHIYVTGGYSGSTNLDAVEKYDPSKDEWVEISPMLNPRFGHGCTVVKEKIYVCGGFDKISQLCSAEVYDPHAENWTFISSMETARQFFSLVSHKRKIYALGGLTEKYEITRKAEIYDPENDQWSPSSLAPEGFEFAVSIPTSGDANVHQSGNVSEKSADIF